MLLKEQLMEYLLVQGMHGRLIIMETYMAFQQRQLILEEEITLKSQIVQELKLGQMD